MLPRVLTVYISAILLVSIASQTAEICGNELRVNRSDIGVRLGGFLIMELEDSWRLHECARRCAELTHCLSFNFARDLGLCQLNSANKYADLAQVVANVSFIYVDIASWPQRPSDICSSKPCSGTDRCVSLGNSHLCLSTGCTEPLSSLNGASMVPGTTSFGSIRKYVCPEGKMVQGNSAMTCTGSSWSSSPFTCDYVRSCTDLQACNSAYSDGEYWLYPIPYGSTPTKIYCSGLTTTTPKSYITVSPKENAAVNGANATSNRSRLDFTKIGINTDTMLVNRTDLTFSTSSGLGTANLWYGRGGDCECESWCAPALGSFRIDTSNTGLIVDPTLVWQGYGYYGITKDFSRNSDGTIITARCGGYCGGCETYGNMTLQLNPAYVVDPATATTPTCT